MNKQRLNKTRPLAMRGIIAGLLWATTGVTALATETPHVVGQSQIERVKVEQVQLNDGTVRGVVVNQSDQRVENLTLRVSYQWRWQDEFHPGTDSPGFSTTMRVAEPLAPGEQREFQYAPEQSLPTRNDGRFAPDVSVVSFTVYDGAAQPQASN